VKNISLTYSPYNLKLNKPFKTSSGEISVRKGFVISITGDSAAEGIGEAAPLPEFGSESFEEDEEALKNIRLNLKLDFNNLISSVEECLVGFNHLPALKSGIEQAALNLICIERKTTLSELFNRPVSRNISVNGIIGLENLEDSINEARQLRLKGFRTIKVKAGRENFEDDYAVVENVRREVGKNIRIRVDANGKWKPADAINNIKRIEAFDIEYVEQPVSSIDDFKRIKDVVSIPLAADESLRNYNDAMKIIENNLAQVLILKPMMLGGLSATLKINDAAEKNNIKVVITSSFETSIGRSVAVFAAAVLKQRTAHGLAVADYFQNTIVNDPFPVTNGLIMLG
jgi:o-succinylbenzoate synthase